MSRVWVAAGVSLALHALVLFVVLRRDPPPAPRERPVHVDVMRVAVISPAARAVAAPSAGNAKTVHARVLVQAVLPESSRGAPEASAVLPESSPGAPEASAVLPESSRGALEKSAAEPAIDTAALSRRLQEGALRCYPAAARRFRQTGEALVRFCLDGAGALRESTVSGTSGSELLDRAARECVIPGAAPFGPETFGRCFTLPVRFHN